MNIDYEKLFKKEALNFHTAALLYSSFKAYVTAAHGIEVDIDAYFEFVKKEFGVEQLKAIRRLTRVSDDEQETT